MWHRFPQPMRDVILSSLSEAARNGRALAEPEDLLAGVYATPECMGAHLLRELGPTPAVNRAGHSDRAAEYSDRAMCVLEQAYEEAADLNDRLVGSDHLLLALARAEPVLAG